MDSQDDTTRIPFTGLLIAFLIPLAVAGLIALLVSQEGAHEVVLIGVPRDQYRALEVASSSEALVSRDEAIARAKDEAGAGRAPVRQAVLGRYTDDAHGSVRGQLVWFINFGNPDEISRGPVSCGIGSAICECYWAYRIGYVYSAIDAMTGEWLFQAEGGGDFDLSGPARADSPPISENERERCKKLVEQEIARSR